MARLPNPLVYDLLELAEILVQQRGRKNLEQAAMRRAVSTVYYALFHALCYVCSDGLVRWSRAGLVYRTYRSLDHKTAKNRLTAFAKSGNAHPSLKAISATFDDLQAKRHDADYEAPKSLFNRKEAMAAIETAREAIALIAELDEDARRWLAVELLLPRRTA